MRSAYSYSLIVHDDERSTLIILGYVHALVFPAKFLKRYYDLGVASLVRTTIASYAGITFFGTLIWWAYWPINRLVFNICMQQPWLYSCIGHLSLDTAPTSKYNFINQEFSPGRPRGPTESIQFYPQNNLHCTLHLLMNL